MILAALLLALPAAADKSGPKPLPHIRGELANPKSLERNAAPNFKVSFKLRDREIEHEGSFVVQGGAQGNYVEGGEEAVDVTTSQGKGLEFHKKATVVNCVVVADPNRKRRARAECQFELSGRAKSKTSEKERDAVTLQLQTSFEAEYGKPVVLADGPERRVEAVVEELER